MREYISNNKKHGDCVIVGVYNTLSFLGRKVAYWKIEDIAMNYFEYTPTGGFPTKNLESFFKFWEINAEIMQGVGQAEQTILNGNASVAIIKKSNANEWHFIFIKPGENRTVEVINDNRQWIDIVLEHGKKELALSMWNVGKAA